MTIHVTSWLKILLMSHYPALPRHSVDVQRGKSGYVEDPQLNLNNRSPNSWSTLHLFLTLLLGTRRSRSHALQPAGHIDTWKKFTADELTFDAPLQPLLLFILCDYDVAVSPRRMIHSQIATNCLRSQTQKRYIPAAILEMSLRKETAGRMYRVRNHKV